MLVAMPYLKIVKLKKKLLISELRGDVLTMSLWAPDMSLLMQILTLNTMRTFILPKNDRKSFNFDCLSDTVIFAGQNVRWRS